MLASAVTMLRHLRDVLADGWSDGDVPVYNEAADRFEPGAGGGGASELDDLTDVDVTTDEPDDGDALVYDGTAGLWVPGEVASGDGPSDPNGAYAETVGDGTEVTFDVVHGLGTRQIGGLAAWDVTTDPEESLSPAWLIVDADTVRVTFSSAPDTDGARVVVLAAGGESSGGGGGVGASRIGATTEDGFPSASLNAQQAYAARVVAFTDLTLNRVRARCNSGSSIQVRILKVGQGNGNATVTDVIHETGYQAVSTPGVIEWSSIDAALVADGIYCVVFEVESGTFQMGDGNDAVLGHNALPSTNDLGLNASRGVGVGGSLSQYSNSIICCWLDYMTS